MKLSRFKEIYRIMPPRDRRLLPLLMLFGLLNTGLESIGIGLIFPLLLLVIDINKALTNPFIAQVYAYSGFEQPIYLAYATGVLVMAVLLIKNVVAASIGIWSYYFAQRVGMSLSCDLFRKYMNAPYRWHVQNNSAKLIVNVDSAIVKLVEAVLIPCLQLVNELLVMIGIVAILIYLDAVTSVSLAVLIGLLGFGYYRLTSKLNVSAGTHLMRLLSQLLQTMQEALGAIKEIRVLGREEMVIDEFARQRRESMRWRTIFGALQTLPHYVVETGIGIIMIAMLLVLLRLHGSETAIPVLGVIGAAGIRLMPSANRVLSSLQRIRSGEPAADIIFSDYRKLAAFDENKQPPAVKPSPAYAENQTGTLELKDVSFSYDGRDLPAIKNISLTIPKGIAIGFVGSTGAGKTTLADMIVGLLEPQSGSIMYNGENIYRDLVAWQSRIGYVPQNVFLADDSFARNIALGIPDEDIDQARLWRAIERACLDDFLSTAPGGLQARIGEKGIRISGGQRQRVGIARAFYHDPQIIVLDEATSALDGETEVRLSEVINRMVGDKTVIIVAHRLSTVKNCDRIALIKDGNLADVGSFEALAERNDDFARMISAASLKRADYV